MSVISLGLSSFQVSGSLSISGVTLQLVNDSVAPGNNYAYGTNASGTKGWFTVLSLIPTDELQIVLRQGSDAERQTVVFAEGEPVWTTDLHQLWMGDGSTLGGVSPGLSGPTLTGTTTVSGLIRITNTTDATDATGATGSLGALGGLSVAKSGWFGGGLTSSPIFNVENFEYKTAIYTNPAFTAIAESAGANMLYVNGTFNASTYASADITGANFISTYSGSGSPVSHRGLYVGSIYSGSGGSSLLMGASFDATVTDTSSGTVAAAYGLRARITKGGLGDGPTITNAYGAYLDIGFAGATKTNAYGLYVANVTASTLAYSIYTGTGVVRFGDTTDASDASGTTGALGILGGFSVKKSAAINGPVGIGSNPYLITSNWIGLNVRPSEFADSPGFQFGASFAPTFTTGADAGGVGVEIQPTVPNTSHTYPSIITLYLNPEKPATPTVTRYYGLLLSHLSEGTTENFGVKLGDVTGAASNWAIYTGTGVVRFGDTLILDKSSDAFRITSSQTPASAGAAGTAGTICWDDSYVYVCTATNTWKRAAIATWP